jgi:hypothetical protein
MALPQSESGVSRRVWSRAGGRCEYCRIPQFAFPLPFQIDHIVAEKQDGETVDGNLALAFLGQASLSQFHGPGHQWDVLLRLTPDGGEPVFLSAAEKLPDVPDTKISGGFTGTFRVGEGAYQVDALLKKTTFASPAGKSMQD